ncbi:hypothetical protein [Amycolatopsis sp. Hca4]|uniref:hypothetical protein n=1 Tax=Amycolatopsis sp. Hca4 TaxID=2742131 RepID=UPI00159199ED|nr:hypothetical protein [Amycolatopsis sp. Hca4]QKV80631.1 hypothetical protein HUT10_47790 [Amycolatopsis sp. Hca4]
MYRIEVPGYEADRLRPALGPRRAAVFAAKLGLAARALAGRRLVNVTGDDRRKGGVYEVMRSVLPYLVGAGIEVEWLNLGTPPEARPALEYFHVLAHGIPPAEDWYGLLARELRNWPGSAGLPPPSWRRFSGRTT